MNLIQRVVNTFLRVCLGGRRSTPVGGWAPYGGQMEGVAGWCVREGGGGGGGGFCGWGGGGGGEGVRNFLRTVGSTWRRSWQSCLRHDGSRTGRWGDT